MCLSGISGHRSDEQVFDCPFGLIVGALRPDNIKGHRRTWEGGSELYSCHTTRYEQQTTKTSAIVKNPLIYKEWLPIQPI